LVLVGFRLGSGLVFSFSSGVVVVVGHDDVDDDYAYTHTELYTLGLAGQGLIFGFGSAHFKKRNKNIN